MGHNDSEPLVDNTPWWELRAICLPELADAIASHLWEIGASGVEETETSRDGQARVALRAYFNVPDPAPVRAELEARLTTLDTFLPGALQTRISTREVEVRDWNEAWKAHFVPTPVTNRLIIRPSWETYNPSPGQVVITIDPGMAFGTGTHETTRGCLRVIDALYGGDPIPDLPPTFPATMLDVGTGSAILLIAALKLGATQATGTDNDPLAVTAAEENCRLNGVEARATLSESPVDQIAGTFDLVVANILAPTLEEMAPALAAHLNAQGTLCLSGILTSQADHLVHVFQRHHLAHVTTLTDNAWATVVMRRSSP